MTTKNLDDRISQDNGVPARAWFEGARYHRGMGRDADAYTNTSTRGDPRQPPPDIDGSPHPYEPVTRTRACTCGCHDCNCAQQAACRRCGQPGCQEVCADLDARTTGFSAANRRPPGITEDAP